MELVPDNYNTIQILFRILEILILILGIRFLYTVIKAKHGDLSWFTVVTRVLEMLVIVGLPLMYIGAFDWGLENDCCSDSATFSPEHRLTVYGLIALYTASFLVSSWKKTLAPPLVEVLLNVMLLIGIGLNVAIMLHVKIIGTVGNLPIILLLATRLANNLIMVMERVKAGDYVANNDVQRLALRVLSLKVWQSLPILIVLCVPVLVLLCSILLLFGQKPDSLVRAFTDTYKHGFSQLDYLCEGVNCPGHFLCSVAAGGHAGLVKPLRTGNRWGTEIVCNRQLLVANAFEEILQERLPRFHAVVRRNYNKVGRGLHKHYGVFGNPFVADIIYVLMKPAEWCFTAILYLVDRNPESRIERQYLPHK
ncbi:MAG: hypothetical protein MUF71_08850 [Candidatus Kapabacteria bacterium]|jgi:hypothetical protein|nr:hypothetical protein [Candidatus Kapabacteria bacterium]